MSAAAPARTTACSACSSEGEAVKRVARKGDWTEIEAPANAYAFHCGTVSEAGSRAPRRICRPPAETPAPVAPAEPRHLFRKRPRSGSPLRPKLRPSPTAPAETPAVTPATRQLRARPNASCRTRYGGAAAPSASFSAKASCAAPTSIQAPTHFALVSPENGRLIDYLHTTSPEPGSAALQRHADRGHGRGSPGGALGQHAGASRSKRSRS